MKKVAAILLVLLACCAGAGYWYWQTPVVITSAEAVVEGRLAVAGVSVPGVVKEVYVKAGDTVTQGQPLLLLDPAGYEARLVRERTALAEMAAQLPPNLLVQQPGSARPAPEGKPLAVLRSEEDEARKRVEVAAHSYAAANLAFSRLEGASPSGYAANDPQKQAARIARDEAAIAVKQARDDFEKASYARARRETEEKAFQGAGPIPAALAARVAEYQAQISRVRLAEQSLAATLVTAPEDGRVAAQVALPGASLAAGDTPVLIVPETSQDRWVMAFFDMEEVAKFTPGLECGISLDTLKDSVLKGTIGRVLPTQDAEKNVAVRVNLDQDDLPDGVSPGEKAAVTVRMKRFRLEDTVLGKLMRD